MFRAAFCMKLEIFRHAIVEIKKKCPGKITFSPHTRNSVSVDQILAIFAVRSTVEKSKTSMY